MGHRHTPKENGGARVVCDNQHGSAEAVTERAMKTSKNWGVRIALFALRFYKAYLSVLFVGSCRFEPSCSQYAYEAIERFGVARGVWLGSKRLLRCQPLSRRFGYDPVPERWGSRDAESRAVAECAHTYRESQEVHS
jgi:hypothetical protein